MCGGLRMVQGRRRGVTCEASAPTRRAARPFDAGRPRAADSGRSGSGSPGVVGAGPAGDGLVRLDGVPRLLRPQRGPGPGADPRGLACPAATSTAPSRPTVEFQELTEPRPGAPTAGCGRRSRWCRSSATTPRGWPRSRTCSPTWPSPASLRILDSAAQLNAGSFAPAEHQFPLDRIAALEAPAAESSAVFADAAERLSAIDSDGFAGPLKNELDQLRDEVEVTSTTLETAVRATRLMPALLGGSGPRDYLLVFQNNAELRATGGLPGVMSLIHAENGRVDIIRQASAGAMGELDEPVLPLSGDELDLFGRQLGTYFLDSNFTPDLPRAAELWRARWQLETDTDIDGVFVVDPVAVSYLLESTGRDAGRGPEPDRPDDRHRGRAPRLPALRQPDRPGRTSSTPWRRRRSTCSPAVRATRCSLVEGLVRGRERAPHPDPLVRSRRAGGDRRNHHRGGGRRPGDRRSAGRGLPQRRHRREDVVLPRPRGPGHQRVVRGRPADADGAAAGHLGHAARTCGTCPRWSPGSPTVSRTPSGPGDQVVVADLYAPAGGVIRDLAFDGEPLPDPAIDQQRGPGRRLGGTATATRADPGGHLEHGHRPRPDRDRPRSR